MLGSRTQVLDGDLTVGNVLQSSADINFLARVASAEAGHEAGSADWRGNATARNQASRDAEFLCNSRVCQCWDFRNIRRKKRQNWILSDIQPKHPRDSLLLSAIDSCTCLSRGLVTSYTLVNGRGGHGGSGGEAGKGSDGEDGELHFGGVA